MKKETVENLKNMKYEDFLQTDYWKMVSEQARINAHYKCQLCGCNDKKLNVHHNTYEHRGEEFKHMEDLICLCEDCHNFYHIKDEILERAKTLHEKFRGYVEKTDQTIKEADQMINGLGQRIEQLIQVNNELEQEKNYAEWKLLNFYKAQKGKTHSELQCMINFPNEKERELPF